MPGDNGDHVTWRELNLALQPLKQEVSTIDGKVDAILLRLARDDGALSARGGFLDSKWRVIGLTAAVFGSSSFAFIVALLLRRHS